MAAEQALLERIASTIDPQARLLRSWQLPGGVSAQVTALEIERPGGQRQTVVLRQHGRADLAANPDVAANELRLLEYLHGAGIAVPQPFFAKQGLIVMAYVEGAAEQAPPAEECTSHLAAHLAAIHTLADVDKPLRFLPSQEQRAASLIDERTAQPSAVEADLRARLAPLWPLRKRANRTALLHGDLWPGNIIWRGGQLAAVIDWEDAALGDPLADVANTRLEMLWAYGDHALRSFTEHYQAAARIDMADLPFWDLYHALRVTPKLSTWGFEAQRLQRALAQLDSFISNAWEHVRTIS